MNPEPPKLRLIALLVSNQIDSRHLRSNPGGKIVADSSSELMVDFGGGRYQYFFNYGVIVLSGYAEEEIQPAIKQSEPFFKGQVSPQLREDFHLEPSPDQELELDIDRIRASRTDQQSIRIMMMNMAQSIALDRYNSVAENLLDEVKGFTRELEKNGRLQMGRRNIMRFIGKALGTKNDITDNIYIFDSPEIVWDDPYLDQLYQSLRRHFDIRVRTNEIEYTLRTISENLDTYREIYNQREASKLEWIIILLILVEVLDMLATRFL